MGGARSVRSGQGGRGGGCVRSAIMRLWKGSGINIGIPLGVMIGWRGGGYGGHRHMGGDTRKGVGYQEWGDGGGGEGISGSGAGELGLGGSGGGGSGGKDIRKWSSYWYGLPLVTAFW